MAPKKRTQHDRALEAAAIRRTRPEKQPIRQESEAEPETQSEAGDQMDPTRGEVVVRWRDGVPLRLLQDPTVRLHHFFSHFCGYTLPDFCHAVDEHFELSSRRLRREALVCEGGLDFLAAQRQVHDTNEPVIFHLDTIPACIPRPVTSLVNHPDENPWAEFGESRRTVGGVTVIRKLPNYLG
ncbi:hypothetical protein HBH56_091330 [Parastagonospora nodorum]|uniref:Uncharacterized protein n=1 Tax=Phaeosphaeria nodorum (strain SN15 / ATCC MYA-4574 / FGSC 10173) TaxID=321614 RepID=A0A7U2F407_PHANO|nr:hypothetical protein HBH56_091330 [Parastagonospora nodorum]QRC98289.1 hypothetical protein JI435_043690 [Parastagonospora nodorum SN15]KAH3936566.1 hypothetical protein HBH54_025970 [Parastagonospora nodorum]KAH4034379.1 hypothetical protein HBI09_109820 [Parastagonospora nodorum]KAH4144864.1 hypothetical protein HBH45_016460 [Parastagonospora nodorum]